MASIGPRSLNIGGRVYDAQEIAALKSGTTGVILYGQVVTSGRWTTLREANATAGFVVPTDKILVVDSLVCYTTNASASTNVNVLYGDTDVGQDSAAAPTNPVYVAGLSVTPVAFGPSYSNVNGQTSFSGSVLDFQTPEAKYPCVKAAGANTSVVVYCFIIDE